MVRCLTRLAAMAVLLSSAHAASPIVHSVYFELKSDTPDNRKALLAACEKYLARHEGCTYFAAGVLAEELDRDVNDRDFDVAAHIVFQDQAAHDRYQTHERHLAFIDVALPMIARVRVFDTELAASAADSD